MSGAKTGSGAALKAIGVIVILLGAIGYAGSQGWIGGTGGDGDPLDTEGGPEESARLVMLSSTWGHFEDTGEVWEGTDKPKLRFVVDDRNVTITYWIDGVRYLATRDDDPGEPWVEYLALQPGTEIRLLVEQHEYGGLLTCWISVNGTTLPGGFMERNDAGDCDITSVVE